MILKPTKPRQYRMFLRKSVMAAVIVTKTDENGKDLNEELEFEFKKDKGEIKVYVKTRKKTPQGKWSDPPTEITSAGAQFGQKDPAKTDAGFTDGTTTIYDKNSAIVIEVQCPHADDKKHKPFIEINGSANYIDHRDQDRLVKEIKDLGLPKKK
jgi:hypothetical protein